VHALEALAGEAAHVGAPGEQVDERPVGARRQREIAGRLATLAEGDQRHHVTGVAVAPGAGARQRRA